MCTVRRWGKVRKPPAYFPDFAAGESQRGSADEAIRKILGGNVVRVPRANE